MRTVKFPQIFTGNSTNVWKSSEHLQATKQSVKLLLKTERGELFGDPYYGLLFKHYLFDNNSWIIRDQLIDIIYSQLKLFISQLKIDRKDIEIIQDRQKGTLYCTFRAVNMIDYTLDNYNIVLFNDNNN